MGTNMKNGLSGEMWRCYNFNFRTISWCGFEGVYEGFVLALEKLTNTATFQEVLKPLMKTQCQSLGVAGHSLGGACAGLYAACTNNPLTEKEHGWGDQQKLL